MNPRVAEWISKAEGDFLTAGRELRARKSPNYDAVCFHAQQCAEKYLKAVLQENERNIPKIHNLIELMILSSQIQFTSLKPNLPLFDGRFSISCFHSSSHRCFPFAQAGAADHLILRRVVAIDGFHPVAHSFDLVPD